MVKGRFLRANAAFLLLSSAMLVQMPITAQAQPPAAAATPRDAVVMWAGVISKPEMTTYQYGSHVLTGRRLDGSTGNATTAFALRGDARALDRWIGRRVIITGHLVEGYPVDSGPPLIQVTAIEGDSTVSIPEIPGAETDLARMPWRLSSANGTASGARLVASMTFGRNGTFTAHFCNRISGRYSILPENRIAISGLVKTRMLCRGPIMQAENLLGYGTYDYDITKGYLTLQRGNDSLVFRRASTGRENPMAN